MSLILDGSGTITGATTLASTASININGTVGATTPAAVAATTLSATGITTVAAGSAALPAIVSTTGTADTGIWFPAADTVAASTGGTERLRINSSGNVGIGTSSPAFKLDVNGRANISQSAVSNYEMLTLNQGYAGSASRLRFINTSGGTCDIEAVAGLASTMALRTADTERLRIDSSGGFILAGSTAQKATGTTWSNPSDKRIKDNIRDYSKGLTELMQVRVREWEYNGKGGTVEGTKGLGVVADEVMTVLPNTVENYNAKLNVDDEETTAIKKFDATEITWLLVKTVQEQQALIVQLQADVAALKDKP